MSSWRLWSRPIGDGERRPVFVAVALLLVAAAVALSLARQHPHPVHPASSSSTPPVNRTQAPSPPPAATTSGPSIPTPDGGRLSGSGPAGAMVAGRAFLLAYLRFSYGQAPPRFRDAAAPLAAQLARFHVDVGPALRSRHLALLALRAEPRDGGFEVGALASDGTATFPIAAIVNHIDGRWLAVRVVTAAAGP